MRQFFHKVHLWISIPLGLIFFISCLTGALLVFEQDIQQLRQASLYHVTPAATPSLQPAQLAERIQMQMPDTLKLASLQIFQAPDKAALATFEGAEKKSYAVDPYTGQIKGSPSSSTFFQTVRKLHRWLLNPPPSKTAKSAGKVIIGVSTLLMAVVLITGLICWWPRTRRMLRNRLSVSTRHGKLRFWYDTHVSLGFYALIFLLLMALTGLTWSFQWYRKAAYGLFGANQPAKTGKADTSPAPSKPQKPTAAFDYAVWNRTATEAAEICPNYEWLKLTNGNQAEVLPADAPLARATDRLLTDRHSGQIKNIERWTDKPRADKAKAWFYAVHTGSWGGMLTQILYAIAALIGASLPLTGYYMWWQRRKHASRPACQS